MHSGSQRIILYVATNHALPYCSPSLCRVSLASGLHPAWTMFKKKSGDVASKRWGFNKSTEKKSCRATPLSQFPPYSAHLQPKSSGFAFWLQKSIKPAQKHSPFALRSKLLQLKLLYNSENSGRWVWQIQIHRSSSQSLCWHQAVPFLTCLPQPRWLGFSVSWWRGTQCLLYGLQKRTTQPGLQKCHWDPPHLLAFLWVCCFWCFTPSKSRRTIHNEQASGEWEEGPEYFCFLSCV